MRIIDLFEKAKNGEAPLKFVLEETIYQELFTGEWELVDSDYWADFPGDTGRLSLFEYFDEPFNPKVLNLKIREEVL